MSFSEIALTFLRIFSLWSLAGPLSSPFHADEMHTEVKQTFSASSQRDTHIMHTHTVTCRPERTCSKSIKKQKVKSQKLKLWKPRVFSNLLLVRRTWVMLTMIKEWGKTFMKMQKKTKSKRFRMWKKVVCFFAFQPKRKTSEQHRPSSVSVRITLGCGMTRLFGVWLPDLYRHTHNVATPLLLSPITTNAP